MRASFLAPVAAGVRWHAPTLTPASDTAVNSSPGRRLGDFLLARRVSHVVDTERMPEPVRSSRQARKLPPVKIEDLTVLILVPGRPQAVRAFTDTERDLAEQYAADEGGVVVPLGPDKTSGSPFTSSSGLGDRGGAPSYRIDVAACSVAAQEPVL